MCRYPNNYNNLNGCSLHSVYIFIKNVQKKCIPYKSGQFSKLQKLITGHYGFKAYPYPNILIPLANNICFHTRVKKKGIFLKISLTTLNFSKWGG